MQIMHSICVTANFDLAYQARPVSARPTMAALLEKMPPDYTLATCPEKPSEDTIKVRPVVPQKPEDITSKMPADWRQQLLRHIEAKRLDRVRRCIEDILREKKWPNRHTNTEHSEYPPCLYLCQSLL